MQIDLYKAFSETILHELVGCILPEFSAQSFNDWSFAAYNLWVGTYAQYRWADAVSQQSALIPATNILLGCVGSGGPALLGATW